MLRFHAPEHLGHGLVSCGRRRRPPRPGRAGSAPQRVRRRGVDCLQLLFRRAGRRERQARVVERAKPPRSRHRRAGRRRRVAQPCLGVARAVVVGVRRQGPVGRGDGVDGRGQVSLRFVGQARGRPGDAAELGAPARVRPQLGARLRGDLREPPRGRVDGHRRSPAGRRAPRRAPRRRRRPAADPASRRPRARRPRPAATSGRSPARPRPSRGRGPPARRRRRSRRPRPPARRRAAATGP